MGFRVLVCTAALVSVAGLSAEKAQAEDPAALAWESRYNQPYSRDLGKAVATDPAGNIYVTGAGTGYAGTLYTDDPDLVTVKYDPTGAEVWKALHTDFIAGRRWLRVLVRTLLLPVVGAVSLLVGRPRADSPSDRPGSGVPAFGRFRAFPPRRLF